MNEVRQTKNVGMLVGILSEKKLEITDDEIILSSGKKSPCKLVKGEISLETDNGVFKLRLFCRDRTVANEPNKMFKGFETIADTYVSKLDASKDSEKTADVVSCTVQVSCNDYVGQDGKLKSGTQLFMKKSNRVTGDYDSTTDLDIEGVIRSVKPEIRNEEETGRLLVEFVLISYGGKAEPITVIVNEDMANDFNDMYEVGQTCELYCTIVMQHVGEDNSKKQAGFGRKANIRNGFDIMEIQVVGGEAPYEEDEEDINGNPKMISMETMKALKNERDIYLEDLVKNSKKKGNSKGGKGKKSSGMGEKKPLASEDLPF